MKVPVLFTEEKSIYNSLNCNVFDINRDALNYSGISAGIYHPPCRAWSRLKYFAKPAPGEIELAIWSIMQIQKYGGVLEHPRSSSLFKLLPAPGSKDSFGGLTIFFNQSDFGHKCEKATGLYIVGLELQEIPSMPINFNAIEFTCGSSKKNNSKKEINKNNRSSTPPDFAKFLIEICKLIETKKLLNK